MRAVSVMIAYSDDKHDKQRFIAMLINVSMQYAVHNTCNTKNVYLKRP